MPPATTVGEVLAASVQKAAASSGSPTSSFADQTISIKPEIVELERHARKRQREDPSVLEMARKLLDARKNEQSETLSIETSALCKDNHRLIMYLKQLGEKLTKARLENSLLKRLVQEGGGQGHAQLLASAHQLPRAVGGNNHILKRSSQLSVADKVSALSVQRVRNQDGIPIACIGSSPPASPLESDTPSPPKTPTQVAVKPGILMSGPTQPQIAAAAASALQANRNNPTGALVDLLRLVEMQLQKHKQLRSA